MQTPQDHSVAPGQQPHHGLFTAGNITLLITLLVGTMFLFMIWKILSGAGFHYFGTNASPWVRPEGHSVVVTQIKQTVASDDTEVLKTAAESDANISHP